MPRLFNTGVFNDVIMGTTAVYTDPKYDELLASADSLAVEAVTDQVTGTNPTVTVVVQHAGDRRNWVDKGAAVINAGALSTSATTAVVGSDPGTSPSLGFVRLKISLAVSAGAASGRVQLYACGRSF